MKDLVKTEVKTEVEIFDSVPIMGTYSIAIGLNRPHKKVLELIDKYVDYFLDFGPLKGRKLKSTGGRAANEGWYN
jgi:hypothetical protein